MSLASLIALAAFAASPAGLDALRSQHQQADQRQQAIEARIADQQAQLEAVSKHIDGLKSQRQGSASPFVPGELDGLLKQSQALSQSLAEVRAEAAQVQAQDEAARSELSRAIDTKLTADRAALGAPNPSPTLVSEIHALESERSALATSVSPAGAGAAVRFHGRTDDPRELRERADALRDRADKIAKEQARVEARIAELRDQAELDRQLRSISRQDALFDESDARVQVQRPAPTAAVLSPSNAAGAPKDSSATMRKSPLYTGSSLHVPAASASVGLTNTNNPAGTFDGSTADQDVAAPTVGIPPPTRANSPVAANGVDSLVTPTVEGQVVRPEDLGTHGSSAAVPLDENSVEDLRVAKARLEQELTQLRQQATALDRQADQAK